MVTLVMEDLGTPGKDENTRIFCVNTESPRSMYTHDGGPVSLVLSSCHDENLQWSD